MAQKPWSEIGEPLAEAIASGAVKRICLQVVEAPGATPAALALGKSRYKQRDSVSVCNLALFLGSGCLLKQGHQRWASC